MGRVAARADDVVETIADVRPVRTAAQRLSGLVGSLLPPGRVKDALSGTPLGHPLHPVIVTGTIGMLTGVSVLDLVGEQRAARRLLVAGLLSAGPTMASGASDWSDTKGVEQRVGLLHAGANYTAVGLYVASYLARRRGQDARGAALALAGGTVMSVGGWLGGHLSYAYGVGVDTTSFAGGPEEWTDVAAVEDLRDGLPHAAEVGGVAVLVVRHRGTVHALRNRCTHRGGPLAGGPLVGDCVECPWHGSQFDITSGEVRRGPATRPQSVYEARERDGRVEVRRSDRRALRANPVAAG